jgi:hypothetical protein
MRRILLLLPLLLLPLDAAAKKPKKPKKGAPVTVPAPAPEAPVRAPLPAWAANLPAEGVLVRLVDPGAEPRESLRLTPVVGQREVVAVDMDMQMSMSMAGMALPAMALPTQHFSMAVEVTGINPQGHIAYSAQVLNYSIDDSDLLPAEAMTSLRSTLSSLTGMTGAVEIDATGRTLSADFSLPDNAPAELQEQISQLQQQATALSMPMPTEAVGVGATWEVLKRTDANGIPVGERTEVTLSGRDGARLTLDSSVQQTVVGEMNGMQGLPPGARVDIARFDSGGSGQAVVELDHLVPASGKAGVDLDMSVNISLDEMPADMPPQGMEMRMSVQVQSRRVEP